MEKSHMLETEDIYMDVVVTVGQQVREMLQDTSEGQTNEAAAATGAIDGGEVSDEQAAERAEKIKDHVVPVDAAAPSCCIDGRYCVHTLDGGETSARASVAGGALVTAYAAAELIGWFGNDDSSTAERLARVKNVLTNNGINPGNHCDEIAVENEFKNPDTQQSATGCGADDRFLEIIAKPYQNPSAVNKLVKPLMGDAYNENVAYVEKPILDSKTKDWDPAEVINAIGDGAAIEVLESKHGEPNHGHRESVVFFNYNPDTTVDRDTYVQDTGEQLFVVDMWYIDKLATALAGGPNAAEQAQQLKQAMIAYQVATYLTLCNGSQRVLIGNK